MRPTEKSVKSIEKMSVEAKEKRLFVSIAVAAYNEAAIIEKSLTILCKYMESLETIYRWELIVVNDGSTDNTGVIADTFAKTRKSVRVLHHSTNFQLGQALRFAFNNCRGDYIVTMDLDLSYSPDHIERMLKTIQETKAKVVIASPYMKGGKITNVPLLRRTMSIWANKFLSLTSKSKISTITGMVRAYDRKFLNQNCFGHVLLRFLPILTGATKKMLEKPGALA